MATARISSTPSTACSSFSMGLSSRRSASSGEMPSWIRETKITGMATSGSASLGMA